eukprot:11016242-Alexandrium_andersonii.AAC.1
MPRLKRAGLRRSRCGQPAACHLAILRSREPGSICPGLAARGYAQALKRAGAAAGDLAAIAAPASLCLQVGPPLAATAHVAPPAPEFPAPLAPGAVFAHGRRGGASASGERRCFWA